MNGSEAVKYIRRDGSVGERDNPWDNGANST